MNKKGKPHFDNDQMIVVIIMLIITNGNISKKNSDLQHQNSAHTKEFNRLHCDGV